MNEAILEKIERIENLLIAINGKIDNFMGFEDLDDDEKDEVKKLRKEVESGKYMTSDEVFGDKECMR